ncbi:MAG: peptidylprolyl isomerase [Clostridia bacterium]|nr:peptidylprolyl isomerase [Clostridia bacterium]
MLFSLFACGEKKDDATVPDTQQSFDVTAKETVNIKIVLTDGRAMEAELYPQIAPITVQNFVDLCTSGFYDGLIFHRVIKDFMIQGGDPSGDGTGGSGKTIKGEFSANGVRNGLTHVKGVLSMARKGYNRYTGEYNYDSATSQFFIVSAESYPSLDGQYAAFGKLTSGYDVLDQIQSVETDANDKPLEDVTIRYIRVVD